jgi:hypothetical protein
MAQIPGLLAPLPGPPSRPLSRPLFHSCLVPCLAYCLVPCLEHVSSPVSSPNFPPCFLRDRAPWHVRGRAAMDARTSARVRAHVRRLTWRSLARIHSSFKNQGIHMVVIHCSWERPQTYLQLRGGLSRANIPDSRTDVTADRESYPYVQGIQWS